MGHRLRLDIFNYYEEYVHSERGDIHIEMVSYKLHMNHHHQV